VFARPYDFLQSDTFMLAQLDMKVFLAHGHLLSEECAIKSLNYQELF
jgi:hypothetical protein